MIFTGGEQYCISDSRDDRALSKNSYAKQNKVMVMDRAKEEKIGVLSSMSTRAPLPAEAPKNKSYSLRAKSIIIVPIEPDKWL